MMWPMDISTGLDFAASPDDVYAMMTDQAYLEEVCVASESISYDVSVTESSTPDLAYARGAGVGRPVHRARSSPSSRRSAGPIARPTDRAPALSP